MLSGQPHCLMETGGCWVGRESKRDRRRLREDREMEVLKQNCNEAHSEIMH